MLGRKICTSFMKTLGFLLFAVLTFFFMSLNILNSRNRIVTQWICDKDLSIEKTKLMFSSNDVTRYENGFGNSKNAGYVEYIRQRWINKPSDLPLKLKNIKEDHNYAQVLF